MLEYRGGGGLNNPLIQKLSYGTGLEKVETQRRKSKPVADITPVH